MPQPELVRRLFDGAVAGIVAALGVVEIWLPLTSVMGDGSRVVSTAVVLLVCAALAFRRRWPLPVAVIALFTWPVIFTIEPLLVLFWGQFVPMAVAVFSVARHGRGSAPAFGAMAGAATLLFMDLRVDVLQEPGEIVFHWLVLIVAWSFGWALNVMERRAQDSMQRVIDVEVAAAEATMAAIVEERTRIARELHDLVAHSVTVMTVQAGAAEQVVSEDLDYVRTALRTIRTTGNSALSEMRRVVAILRDAEGPDDLSPQPGVASLASLVDEACVGGLHASLDIEGHPRTLPAGLDLAVYRIVQEALTNVRRHATATRASVRLRYADDCVELEVRDDGTGAPKGFSAAGGHGLIGMRERAMLYGGRLETASTDGFTVRAVLPAAPS